MRFGDVIELSILQRSGAAILMVVDFVLNSWVGLHWLTGLNNVVRQLEKVDSEVRSCFAGLIDPIWIGEYQEA